MVSSSEADFNLRGSSPPSQDLARWDGQCVGSKFNGYFPRRHGQSMKDHGRLVRTNLTYPVPTEEPAVAGIGCSITATYVVSFESVTVNMGDPSDDANESGSSEVETPPKTSDASGGSQRGHSSRSAGKPHTWQRAPAL
jgi:hypothetical protein